LVGLVAAQWPARVLRAADRAAGVGSWTGGRGIMLDKVTVSVFAQWLGTEFRIHSESGRSVDVELIEATALRSQSDAPGALMKREPFSIVFRGPAEPILPQKIYTLEHAKLGRFELFLVPVGPDAKGMCYEAVFN
jgi:hypothetical protein